MKDIEGLSEESYFCFSDYNVLIDSFEYEVLLQVDDNDYQGDSRLIIRDGDRYGLLLFGWGSCSGCDALQACSNPSEVIELRDDLYNQIIWKESAADLLKYIKEKDWEVEWAWHADETKQFVNEAISLLESVVSPQK